MNYPTEEAKIELEDQFILRLPQAEAEAIKGALKRKSKKFKKFLKIELQDDLRKGLIYVNKIPLHTSLVDLPTITESYKMTDSVNLYKTADICQMLICSSQPNDVKFSTYKREKDSNINEKKKYQYPHGISLPLKNVRKFRFRKSLKNKNDVQETADIEKEVLMLLRMDNEAISTKYEIIYEKSKEAPNQKEREKFIFGDLTDSEESPSTSEHENNDIMDFTH